MIAKSRSGELFGEGSNAVLREKFINYGSESMASYKELEEEIARNDSIFLKKIDKLSCKFKIIIFTGVAIIAALMGGFKVALSQNLDEGTLDVIRNAAIVISAATINITFFRLRKNNYNSIYLQAGQLRNKLNGERIKKAKAEGKSPEEVELRPISFDTYDDAIRKKGK